MKVKIHGGLRSGDLVKLIDGPPLGEPFRGARCRLLCYDTDSLTWRANFHAKGNARHADSAVPLNVIPEVLDPVPLERRMRTP